MMMMMKTMLMQIMGCGYCAARKNHTYGDKDDDDYDHDDDDDDDDDVDVDAHTNYGVRVLCS